jgi:hypothetical protein
MNEERIKLPDFLVADLYKHSLVELENYTQQSVWALEEIPAIIEKGSSGGIRYLGENGKKVIIVVKQADAVHLNEPDLTFLTNILKACHLSLTDIAIVNIAGQEITFTEIKEQLHGVHILLFDVDPSLIKLPFIIPAFQVQHYSGCTIMLAPALTLLNQASKEGRLLKTKLWNSLKQVFGIG